MFFFSNTSKALCKIIVWDRGVEKLSRKTGDFCVESVDIMLILIKQNLFEEKKTGIEFMLHFP